VKEEKKVLYLSLFWYFILIFTFMSIPFWPRRQSFIRGRNEQAAPLLTNPQRNPRKAHSIWQRLTNRYISFLCTLSSPFIIFPRFLFRKLVSTEHRSWPWQSCCQSFELNQSICFYKDCREEKREKERKEHKSRGAVRAKRTLDPGYSCRNDWCWQPKG
jgi:hypothetical protein